MGITPDITIICKTQSSHSPSVHDFLLHSESHSASRLLGFSLLPGLTFQDQEHSNLFLLPSLKPPAFSRSKPPLRGCQIDWPGALRRAGKQIEGRRVQLGQALPSSLTEWLPCLQRETSPRNWEDRETCLLVTSSISALTPFTSHLTSLELHFLLY